MPVGLAIGAGIGLLKNEMIDKPRAADFNRLQATKERYSPWTGVHGQPVQMPNPFDAALQFGATGAMMGRAINAPQANAATSYSANVPQAGDGTESVFNAGKNPYDPMNPWGAGGFGK